MTSSTQTLPGRPHAGAATAAHGLGHLLKGLWDAYRTHRSRSATVFQLRGLDDRTLQDIGVDRSEIESIVYAKSGDRVRRYQAK